MGKIPNRIPSLDGLRTISIFLVIAGHFLHVLNFGESSNLGNLGVRVFFVISGFLITGLLLKELETNSKINLLKFYFRRTLRIFPPFYFYLFIIILLISFGFVQISPRYILFSAAYLTNYVPPEGWLLVHSWSLSVEEQFYLIFPGILVLLGIRKTKFFLFFVVLIAPFIRVAVFKMFGDTPLNEKGFHANMDALAIGCLMAIFYTALHQSAIYKKFLSSKLIIILPFAIVFFNLQAEHPLIYAGLSYSAMNFMIALCIDWSVTNYDSVFGKFLNSAPMVTLGMMSYSIYLWQQPFFNADMPNILTQTPFNFIGLTVMTLISYYFVEKFSLKLRQKLEKKFFVKRNEQYVVKELIGESSAS